MTESLTAISSPSEATAPSRVAIRTPPLTVAGSLGATHLVCGAGGLAEWESEIVGGAS
jgi:hypothetical protein